MKKLFSLLAGSALLLTACDMQANTPNGTTGSEMGTEMEFTVTIENVSSGDSATPLAPGVYAVHTGDNPLFTKGKKDMGKGLEALAEDGDPGMLAESTGGMVFNTPMGDSEPGPALPGKKYQFSFKAKAGDKLSFATMYVQSNDGFYAANGMELFKDGKPMTGDVTEMIKLWDGGTEVNEEPGTGENQPPRQGDPNTGEDESENVVSMMDRNDGFTYTNAVKVMVEAK